MTRYAVRFTVIGAAQPKGSARAFTYRTKGGDVRAAVTSDNRSLAGWETNVRSAVQQQCRGKFFEGAVRVAIVFFLPRPKKPKSSHHLTRPDLDKLTRGALDALKGLLWTDDSQVVELVTRKAYATQQPHARIVVDFAETIDEEDLPEDLFSNLEEEIRA